MTLPKNWDLVCAAACACFVLLGCAPSAQLPSLAIDYPDDEALFPGDSVAPIVRWQDPITTGPWEITIGSDQAETIIATVDKPTWRPEPELWQEMKRRSVDTDLEIRIVGMADRQPVSQGSVRIRTSRDSVGAPVFYRQVPLPFRAAQKSREKISWRLGFASEDDPPRTVLEGLHTCANCHSFSDDGKTLAMDLDYSGDKGSYAIAGISRTVEMGTGQLITWRDFRPEDPHHTFGLLSKVSPDGRYVISMVKETTIMHFTSDPYCTQLFFPVRGILAVYDREEDRFFALPGADDPELAQANPTWSPDGKWIVFARAQAHDFGPALPAGESIVPRTLAEPFLSGRETFRYDLYRIPFNEGGGGTAEPLEGASENGMSNYFAEYSPDGEWIVYCRASTFMFNRPDSDLFIVPSAGGKARRLDCNSTERMDSWHSFSPNGRWLVFSSKRNGPFSQLWLTHIDDEGRDTPPVLLEHFTPPNRAANLPEFVNIGPDDLQRVNLEGELRGLPEDP